MAKASSLPITILLFLATPAVIIGSSQIQAASLHASSHANSVDTNYSVIFSDSFNNGDTSHWKFSPNWTVVEEADNWFLRGTPDSNVTPMPPITRADYCFRVDIRIISGTAVLDPHPKAGTAKIREFGLS